MPKEVRCAAGSSARETRDSLGDETSWKTKTSEKEGVAVVVGGGGGASCSPRGDSGGDEAAQAVYENNSRSSGRGGKVEAEEVLSSVLMKAREGEVQRGDARTGTAVTNTSLSAMEQCLLGALYSGGTGGPPETFQGGRKARRSGRDGHKRVREHAPSAGPGNGSANGPEYTPGHPTGPLTPAIVTDRSHDESREAAHGGESAQTAQESRHRFFANPVRSPCPVSSTASVSYPRPPHVFHTSMPFLSSGAALLITYSPLIVA